MGILKKFKNWMFNKTPAEVYREMPDEELIRTKGANEVLTKNLKKVIKQKSTLESQLAEIKAKDIEKKEKVKKEDIENEIAEKLNKDKKPLDEEKFGKLFSLNKLYRKIYGISLTALEFNCRSKFGKNFEISDKNDKVSWKFGEIMISTKGYFVITDIDGKIRVMSPYLKELIYKSESIFNQFKRGRLLLATDENGDYVPELDENYEDSDELEMTIPVYNYETNKYEETKFLRVKIREKIIELYNKIEEFKKKYAIMEKITGELRVENSDLKRAYESLLHVGQKGRTHTSEAWDMMRSSSMEMSDIAKKLSTLSERIPLLEHEIDVRKERERRLLDEIEKTGDISTYQKAMAIIKESIEFVKSNQTVVEKEVLPEKKQSSPPQQR